MIGRNQVGERDHSVRDWESDNEEYLAAALEWLRLRLASPAAARQMDVLVPADPLSAGAELLPELLTHASVHSPDARLAAAEAAMHAAASRSPAPASVRLGQLLGLSLFEQYTLLLCAAMELDPSTAGRCADAHGDPRMTYPTFALALSCLPDPAWDVLSPHHALRRWRLVEISQPTGQPLVTSPLRADERIVNYIKGLNELDDRLEPLLVPVDTVGRSLPDSQLAAVDAVVRWCTTVTGHTVRPLVQLLGPDSRSKRLVAGEAAARLGLRLHRLPCHALPGQHADLETLARLWSRERLLLDAALYVETDDLGGDGREALLSQFLRRVEGLLFLAVDEPWPGVDPPVTTLDVGRPTRAEQHDAWSRVLGASSGSAPDALAGQFDLGVDVIEEIAGRTAVGPDADLEDRTWEACLASTRPRMDALAQRLEPKVTWGQLVLGTTELALLHQIADQVRQRSTVYEAWGFSRRMSRGLGISALFAGPSGTGKTMAAEVLANELRLNLYRIDLSAVVSKYIGETEKNLRRLFDAAEEGGALLFFDEADALFGKRSEVKDSHDRYANIEISYLLQRMESYRGLAVLATNMRGALDQAFLRRLRFVVSFPMPVPTERRAIWQRVFPAATPLGGLDLDRLADLPATGGMIHNIALNAAFAAAHAGSPVTMPIVLASARTEFRKLELPVRDRDFV
jgi:hypothetical protein